MRGRPPELVIFDCDGVLVDSEVISNTVLAQALSAEGLPTTLAEARRDYQGLLLGEVVLSKAGGNQQHIRLRAQLGQGYRFFEKAASDSKDVSGRWAVNQFVPP